MSVESRVSVATRRKLGVVDVKAGRSVPLSAMASGASHSRPRASRAPSFSDVITGPTSLPILRSLVLFTALAVAVWLGVGG